MSALPQISDQTVLREEEPAPVDESRGRLPVVLQPIEQLFQYLYLMRFSLLLWLAMLLLALADLWSPSAVTRGILTPAGGWQWIFTGFTVVLAGWFALLAARLVCAYGPDRFGAEIPPFLAVRDQMRTGVFFGAQVPGLLLLSRIAYNAVHEQEGGVAPVVFFLACGALAALVFWHLIAVLYYWMYDPDPDPKRAARAFLVPKWKFLPLEELEHLPPTLFLHVLLVLVGVLRRLGPGYELNGKLRPGHLVVTLTLVATLLLYVISMPISAPVPLHVTRVIVGGLSAAMAVAVVWLLLAPTLREFRRLKARLVVRVLPVATSLLLFGLFLLGAAQPWAPRIIPVIGYVALLMTVVFWALAGVAFWADRFRIPVLTLVGLGLLFNNLFPAEHTFPAARLSDREAAGALPIPSSYVDRLAFDEAGEPKPVIIVTATGGGIHAAAWTATVLSQLEEKFGTRDFHNHLLLISSVSGGSVASMAYVRQYFDKQPFGKDGRAMKRVVGASQCSSLQAVAWGLTYPDALRLTIPWVYELVPSLKTLDRGWALDRALERNLSDPACVDLEETAGTLLTAPAEQLTLNHLATAPFQSKDKYASKNPARHLPAFTFNSTVAETGDRFLLSNYSVRQADKDPERDLPAASFLGVYGREAPVHPPIEGRGGFADLPLVTAARLSATFTFVSPAARLPFELSQGSNKNAYHFVDGGYYDNDGTSSVIEFLNSAIKEMERSKAHEGKKLRVLLIEIRNGDDLDSFDSPDSYAHQSGLKYGHDGWTPSGSRPERWGTIDQAMAPEKAAVNAGLGSVTRRNRRELDILKTAYTKQLDLQHLVIDYQAHMDYLPGTLSLDASNSEMDQPLSWHLTTRQQGWIRGAMQGSKGRRCSDLDQVMKARDWFDGKGIDPGFNASSCSSVSPPEEKLATLAGR